VIAEPPARPGTPARPASGRGNTSLRQRIDSDPESVERGLASLVLTVVELLRQLMERQALRRVDNGDLSDEQVDRIGATLMALDARMSKLCEQFGLSRDELNLDLGPLGPLLPCDLGVRRPAPRCR
jgi:hypothetical protein